MPRVLAVAVNWFVAVKVSRSMWCHDVIDRWPSAILHRGGRCELFSAGTRDRSDNFMASSRAAHENTEVTGSRAPRCAARAASVVAQAMRAESAAVEATVANLERHPNYALHLTGRGRPAAESAAAFAPRR